MFEKFIAPTMKLADIVVPWGQFCNLPFAINFYFHF